MFMTFLELFFYLLVYGDVVFWDLNALKLNIINQAEKINI